MVCVNVLNPFLVAVVLAACACPAHASESQSDAVENLIVKHVDERQEQALALLERVVNINSGSLNLQGVREVGDQFRAEFEAVGFRTRWLPGEAFGRAGHLVAEHGDRGIHLLLIGHLDTVFEPDSPFQKFERISATSARGPGTTDMKGGNVIIVEAIRALRAAGVLQDLQLTVILIGDEESSGRPLQLARAALVAAADAADVALGFEDGDGSPATAVIARRGYSGWQLEVTGTPAHSSVIFSDAVGGGAIFETSRTLNEFYRSLVGERYLTFNAGVMLGGTDVDFDGAQSRGSAFGKANVVPERAVVSGDLRTISLAQREAAKERMRAIVAAHLPGTSAQITFDDGYPPLAPDAGNKALLAMYDEVSRDLGFGPVVAVDPGAAGAADISFTAGRVDMALDGLGLMGSGGHTVHETADLTTLASQTKRAAVLMYRLGRGFSGGAAGAPD
jgi:glutamate carboxypeptidase